MLTELDIQDFAIIDKLNLHFEPGLVVFTGETGAGKSIILDALSAVLGERVETTSIRKGADKAVVEAVFRLDQTTREALLPLLEKEELLDDPEILVLGREIRSGGRNVARVNGRSVSAALQAEIGALLVDLHGQSEHLSLLKVRNHMPLLDRFAHNENDLADYQADYRRWTDYQAELKDLLQTQQFAKDRADMLKYQIQEISSARLKADEEGELRQERNRLANAESLHSLIQEALQFLDEGGVDAPPATDLVGSAVQSLENLSRIDPQLQHLSDRAEQALGSLAEIAYELRGAAEEIEYNPARLDQIEERLNLISFLKRKYGGSYESVIAHLEKSTAELDKVENIYQQIDEVGQKISGIKQLLSDKAEKLSQTRQLAAQRMAAAVEQALDNLQMQSAQFQVETQNLPEQGGLMVAGQELAFDSHGIDKVEFLIETNPGEGLKPLVKIASGGETSRLMLALKHVLAEADQIPVLVFDEIDQGIGGRVGVTVGKMLWQLGREHQVMCVTHLPQLAAFGDQHFHVSKQAKAGRTLTQAQALQGEIRIQELAGMLGTISNGTLQSAQEILASAGELKGKIQTNG